MHPELYTHYHDFKAKKTMIKEPVIYEAMSYNSTTGQYTLTSFGNNRTNDGGKGDDIFYSF